MARQQEAERKAAEEETARRAAEADGMEVESEHGPVPIHPDERMTPKHELGVTYSNLFEPKGMDVEP